MKRFLLIPALCLMFLSCEENRTNKRYVQVCQMEDQSSPDWQVSMRVKEELLKENNLTLSNRFFISVSTTNGVVTLTGNVGTPEQKMIAEQRAGMAKGVVSVNNQLTVPQ